MTKEKRQYRMLSLFSGAMGLDIGLEETGRFVTIGAVEREPVFCGTIRTNRDAGRIGTADTQVYEKDICDLDPKEVMADLGLKPGELDLLVGGPPCQSFSTTGRRGTTQDRRGLLLWQFLRFVEILQPKIFLMENVRGVISAALHHRPIKDRPDKGGPPLLPDEQPGSVVRLFAKDLDELTTPYRLDIFEVNAVNYGAPQLRERVLFIGNRYNRQLEFPVPTHGNEEGFVPFRTLGDAIKGVSEEEPVILDFSPRKKRYLSLVPPGGNWRSLPVDVQRESMGKAWYAKGGRSGWWRRLSYDLPAPTILTMPNHASTALCHPEEVRALTLRECALVQEFPADWEFSGTAQEQYTQVGNAVPVRLGVVAGHTLADALDDIRASRYRRAKGAKVQVRIVYLKSHVRTRRWYKGGDSFVWSEGVENGHAAYPSAVTAMRVRSLTGKPVQAHGTESGRNSRQLSLVLPRNIGENGEELVPEDTKHRDGLRYPDESAKSRKGPKVRKKPAVRAVAGGDR